MPKKRASTKSRKDEQAKDDDSGSIFQEDDDAKRAKLEPMCDTTLQHLPFELLESILIKAVAMEVLELKVVRSARKEQADLVMERLGTVCWHWNSIITTDIFKKEVHRLLEGEKKLRFEILDQPSFQVKVIKLATLKDEIFLLCSPLHYGPTAINVYNRNNLAEVKDVPLGERMSPIDMASCSVSNCVYILNHLGYYWPSVFRIKKDEEHHFKVSPWLRNRELPFTNRGPMSVASNGNVIIISSHQSQRHGFYVPRTEMTKPTYVSIFDANCSLQHRIKLSPVTYEFRIINSVIQKSDGNLVLLAAIDENKVKLMEFDTTGRILRQYQSSLHAYSVMSFADDYGRILVTDHYSGIELFDREFNLLEVADPRLSAGVFRLDPLLHFNSERNEIVLRLEKFQNLGFGIHGSVLNIVRLKHE